MTLVQAPSYDKPLPFISLWLTLLPSLCVFFFPPQDPEQHKSHRLPGEHFSQLCKHSPFFFWCVGFFLMTQYVFCDQGQFRREDGKGERIGKHTLTHTLTRALWVVCLEHLCVLIEKESNTKSSLSFFCFIPQPRGDTPLFPANIPPLWILIPARERTGPLKCSAREAVRHRAGHHSSVKGVVLTCCPSYQSTFVKYVCIVASAEIHRHINNYCSTPPSPPPCDIHTSEPKW